MVNRKYVWLAGWILASAVVANCGAQQPPQKSAPQKPSSKKASLQKDAPEQDAASSAAPDKVLYEKASNDIKHGRYDVARLTLQTLINTYPDSEYLAKAKLAVADSYYKEGGTAGYTQAVSEYQDFITFFPFLDEAAYAQMQIGMTHYRRMEKPDRDRDEALQAESAFQTYLQKYPNTELAPQVQQRLRDVQEVLAEGDYSVAYFYYIRRVDRAAAARLIELVNRYPLYSEADHANWMLASIFDRTEHADIATQYYARIVKDYPLSPLASEAKAKLVKYGAPVPKSDPTALARMEKEQETPRSHTNVLLGMLMKPVSLLKTGPDMSMAAHTGAPTLTPLDQQNTETLTPGGNLSIGTAKAGSSGGNGTTAYVERVTPGANGSDGANGSSTSGDSGVAGSTTPTPNAGAAGSSAAAADPAPATTSADEPDLTGGAQTGGVGVSGAPATGAAPASSEAQATPAGNQNSGDAASTGSSPEATAESNSTTDPGKSDQKESSSKKKKGLKKIVPF